MRLNLRTVPWMTVFALIGMGIGYLFGRGQPDSMNPVFWGLCSGMLLGLVVRFSLTWQTIRGKTSKPEEPPEPPPGSPRDDSRMQ